MKRFIVMSLSVLLVVGLVAGSGLAFRGPGTRGHRGYFADNVESYDSFAELTEEEVAELEESQRQVFRLSERISLLREEYRQAVIDGVSDEELTELEDQLFELRDEMAELREDSFGRFSQFGSRSGSRFTGMMRGFAGFSGRQGVHCW